MEKEVTMCRGLCEHGLVCVLEAGHAAPCSPMRGFCQCAQPTADPRVEVGDVVQIDPELPRSFFAGCFMLVTELESWGVHGFIAIPGERGTMPARAYFRVKFENLKRIGRAAWIVVEA